MEKNYSKYDTKHLQEQDALLSVVENVLEVSYSQHHYPQDFVEEIYN
jgi:hypothetical protein